MRDTKDIAGRWARATTWHGIADIYNSTTKGQRLLWLFLVTICTGLASWQIYVTVVQYLSGNGYTTNVYFMRSGSIQIPPITVCNINRAKKTVRDKLNMTDSQIEAFYSAILGTYLFSDLGVQSGWASLLASNPYAKDLRGLMSNLAHTCTDMIMYYKESFGFSIPGSQICTNESIVTTVLTLFGQCYSLKNGNLQQIIAGPSGGVKLLLNPEIGEYTAGFTNNYGDNGIVMILATDIYAPYPANPILLSPGTHSFVTLSSTKYTVSKPSPFTIFKLPCDVQGKLKNLKAEYTTTSCYMDCMFTTMIESCSCISVGIEVKNKSIPVCDPTKMGCIIVNVFPSLVNASTKAGQCAQSCQQPCDARTQYYTSVTTSKYPSEGALQSFNQMNGEMINNADIILVDVFFSEIGQLNIETIETTPFFSFIGTIGGQLGLWLGSSMITICQLGYYIIQGLLNCFNKNKAKPKQVLSNESSTGHPSPYPHPSHLEKHGDVDLTPLPIYY